MIKPLVILGVLLAASSAVGALLDFDKNTIFYLLAAGSLSMSLAFLPFTKK